MPWIYNTRAYPVNIRTSDGRMRIVPGKEKTYITPELMSVSIADQCGPRKDFVNQGGDPAPAEAPQAEESKPVVEAPHVEAPSATSSLDVNIVSGSADSTTENDAKPSDGQMPEGDAKDTKSPTKSRRS